MSIQILPSQVIDQIAAGEVVERPSHLIKELVENSVDAGATEIEVEFDMGGRRVRVQDNGKGMSAEELPLALARHATSKISKSLDLWSLETFGFRGEALASIASVCELTLRSRPSGSKTAHQLVSEFGKVSSVVEVGGESGTCFLVDRLFENLPARIKFLKSDTAESTQIKNTLKALAMAHTKVQFRVRHKGKLLYYWPVASTLQERVEQVLEQKEMYYGEGECDGVRARVIVSSPDKTFSTSKNIWLYAQNRWIQDRGLHAAVMDGYRSLLMHREYPIAAVWVECPPEEVDVNIHPTKSQVKFRSPSAAFRAVHRAIRPLLEKAPWVENLMKMGSSQEDRPEVKFQVLDSHGKTLTKEPSENREGELKARSGNSGSGGGELQSFPGAGPEFDKTLYPQRSFQPPKVGLSEDSVEFEDMSQCHRQVSEGEPLSGSGKPKNFNELSSPTMSAPGWARNSLESKGFVETVDYGEMRGGPVGRDGDLAEKSVRDGGQLAEKSLENALSGYKPANRDLVNSKEVDPQFQKDPQLQGDPKFQIAPKWSSLQMIGQAKLTYVITQTDKSVIFIDQHAAHERVAYERLMKGWKKGEIDVQQFLLPLPVDLESEERLDALLKWKTELEKLGFYVEKEGATTLLLKAAPTLIKERGVTQALKAFGDELIRLGGSFALEKGVSDLCATLACHSVVRAGLPLSKEQMESLLEQMDEFPLSSFCPHGRPVFVEYKFSELEGDFGRRG